MPDQSTPEISRLRIAAYDDYPSPGPFVRLDLAIQAVRDTEDRRTREIVEALRGLLAVDDPSAWGAMNGDEAVERAADFIERSFLSPDNPKGNA